MNDDPGLFPDQPGDDRPPRRRARRQAPPPQAGQQPPPRQPRRQPPRRTPDGRPPRRRSEANGPAPNNSGPNSSGLNGSVPNNAGPNNSGPNGTGPVPPVDPRATTQPQPPVPGLDPAERGERSDGRRQSQRRGTPSRTRRSGEQASAAAPKGRAEKKRAKKGQREGGRPAGGRGRQARRTPPPPPDDDYLVDFGDDDGGGRRFGGRRKVFVTLGALTVLVIVGIGVWLGMREFLGIGYSDYEGNGKADVLIQVKTGQSTNDIAGSLVDAGVVASAGAFTSAGENNEDLGSLQPGYYVMKTEMSGQAAVRRIVDRGNRVGQLQIRPGSRLDDVRQPDGKVNKGIYSQLSDASCADLNGRSTCVSPEQLRKTVASTDLASLGVPDWAASVASKGEAERKVEGLIAPDVYQVRPGDSAQQLLKTVLTGGAARLQASGLPNVANDTGFTPYQVLVMASLIQSEAVENDFGKVSRVIYNRLQKNQKLQFDSTINYVLDRPEIRTSSGDRAKAGPYNTYDTGGLPPTPIASPNAEAVKAAASPDEGNWMFFVKCETNGLSCFSVTPEQHQRNIEDAQRRGVY